MSEHNRGIDAHVFPTFCEVRKNVPKSSWAPFSIERIAEKLLMAAAWANANLPLLPFGALGKLGLIPLPVGTFAGEEHGERVDKSIAMLVARPAWPPR